MNEWINEKLLPPVLKFVNTKAITALRNGMLYTMPFTIVGSVFLLLANFPVTAISEWVKKMPSVYVLKEWEAVIRRAQNSMFNELYSYSPNWAKIIWDMLKADSRDNQREFGDFVTKQLTNRIAGYTFDENTINTDDDVCIEELLSVVEGERYIRCSQPQLQAYTGDLFYEPTTDTY